MKVNSTVPFSDVTEEMFDNAIKALSFSCFKTVLAEQHEPGYLERLDDEKK